MALLVFLREANLFTTMNKACELARLCEAGGRNRV